MTVALADVLRGLREMDAAILPEELCEALWLADQGWDDLPSALSALASPGQPADSDHPDARHRSRQPSGPRLIVSSADTTRVYARGQLADGPGQPQGSLTISLPDAPALPQARELSAILRPLRYDPRRTYDGADIDEAATALSIAQAGVRRLAWRTTRRRRGDLDLVFDVGASGPLWARLAVELRVMLESVGAFRSVRFWVLNTDQPGLPLVPAVALTSQRRTSTSPYGDVCAAPRRSVVVVLTDGTGQGWQEDAVRGPLLTWSAHGTVLVVQLLPPQMWHRTALRAFPVEFRPGQGGHHKGAKADASDAELSVVGLSQEAVPRATAIPVIALDPRWLRSWLPLTRGSEAGAVPGYALLIPPQEQPVPRTGHTQEAARQEPEQQKERADQQALPLTPDQRYHQFMLTASQDARRLARLLSVKPLTLPGMRKIRHELLPNSRPEILAEVLLGGLVYWTPVTAAEAMAGTLKLDFHLGVQDLLQERTGGLAELVRDARLVDRALKKRPRTVRSYEVVAVGPGLPGRPVLVPPTAPPLLEPYPLPGGLIATRPGALSVGRPDPGPSAVVTLEEDDPPLKPGTREVRVGIWGSNSSGRTTYLTILGMLGLADEDGWINWRRGEQWRVRPIGPRTKHFVTLWVNALKQDGRFPSATIPGQPQPLSFQLERRQSGGLFGWLRAERMATVSLTLADVSGRDYLVSKEAAEALADSHVLAYFFDPLYDQVSNGSDKSDEGEREKRSHSSADFFNRVAIEVGRLSLRRYYQGFPPHYLAVCVPKLDDQYVFNQAVKYDCVEYDGRTGLPWVPPRMARRLFEAITFDQGTIASYQLREAISHSFHPKRISFHALSSVGFWVGQDGGFDKRDVCNVSMMPRGGPDAASAGSAGPFLRGDIRPVRVLDPLIMLVERYLKQVGQR